MIPVKTVPYETKIGDVAINVTLSASNNVLQSNIELNEDSYKNLKNTGALECESHPEFDFFKFNCPKKGHRVITLKKGSREIVADQHHFLLTYDGTDENSFLQIIYGYEFEIGVNCTEDNLKFELKLSSDQFADAVDNGKFDTESRETCAYLPRFNFPLIFALDEKSKMPLNEIDIHQVQFLVSTFFKTNPKEETSAEAEVA